MKYSILLITILILSNSCNDSRQQKHDFQLSPTPLEPSNLYEIYRKGLLTRHIDNQGRLLEKLSLQNLSLDSPSVKLLGDQIEIRRSSGYKIKFHISSIRYSTEETLDEEGTSNILWVPLLGARKLLGEVNDFQYVVGTDTDNSLYYGGLAVATLSLEKIHGVSDKSMIYARKLIQFMLDSDLNGDSGFIVRQKNSFNNEFNFLGEPYIRGASGEELLGFFIACMFYLKAETPSHPLYQKVVAFRDRVATKLRNINLFESYKNDLYFVAKGEEAYKTTLLYGLLASYKANPDCGVGCKNNYITWLTAMEGRTGTIAEIFHDIPFFNHLIAWTSMIPILEGRLPNSEKKWFAKVFMRDIIKASLTHGPDKEVLRKNAYLAVIAMMCNKYLNEQRDPTVISSDLREIWGDEIGVYSDLIDLHTTFVNPSTSDPTKPYLWQHDLPLIIQKNEKEENVRNTNHYKLHNVRNKIGGWFCWLHQSPVSKLKTYTWNLSIPGWHNYKKSWESAIPSLKENEYLSGLDKFYSKSGFIKKELVERGSNDLQVEGVGVDLLFPTIFLHHLSNTRFPKPQLSNEFNQEWPVLPYTSIPATPSRIFQRELNYNSKNASNYNKIMHGDKFKTLRGVNGINCFLVASANADDKLVLTRYNIKETQEGCKLNIIGKDVFSEFDEVELTQIQTLEGNQFLRNKIILSERGEIKRTAQSDLHGLRIRTFSFNPTSGEIIREDIWKMNDSDWHPEQAKNVDIATIDNKHFITSFNNHNGKNRFILFKIENDRVIQIEKDDVWDDAVYHKKFTNVAANSKVVVFSSGKYLYYSDRLIPTFHFVSRAFENGVVGTKHKTIDYTGYLYDIKINSNYLVAVYGSYGYPYKKYLSFITFRINEDMSLTEVDHIKYDVSYKTPAGIHYDIQNASIKNYSTPELDKGFLLVCKGKLGVLNESENINGSSFGIKVLLLQLDNGKVRIVDSTIMGSGDADAGNSLDIIPDIKCRGEGFISLHKTKDKNLLLNYWKMNQRYINRESPF